jgi:hypothetical protein
MKYKCGSHLIPLRSIPMSVVSVSAFLLSTPQLLNAALGRKWPEKQKQTTQMLGEKIHPSSVSA